MSDDSESLSYAGPDTVLGALQRGLGRGAHRVMSAPDAPELVTACLRRDYRWDRQVDERDVYLARLVRDLRMPIAAIAAQLRDAPPADSDDDNAFAVALGVLVELGRAGVDEAAEAVRHHACHGVRRLEALEALASAWPVARWDDLYPAIAGHVGTLADLDRVWISPPWTVWADRDARIAAMVGPVPQRPAPRRPFADEPTGALLSLLRRADRADDWGPALRELRRRPPEPELLDRAEELAGGAVDGPLRGAVDAMGAMALPAARRWATAAEHPLAWTGLWLLAAHGDATDAPALVVGLDRLDTRPDDLCGYDELVGGLARVGGPVAVAALPRMHRLWVSPHTFERAAYLRAVLALDPAGAQRKLVEGLTDCEADVRLLAVQQAPLEDVTRERLRYLCDDPLETAEVRATATRRLT